jgi:hypothetical protein
MRFQIAVKNKALKSVFECVFKTTLSPPKGFLLKEISQQLDSLLLEIISMFTI